MSEDSGRTIGNIVETTLDAPDPGGVVIPTAFIGVNKDAVVVTGSAPIVRRMPCIAGIEAVGVVEQSEHPEVLADRTRLFMASDSA